MADNWFFALCALYNGAVEERRESYEDSGKSVTSSEQQNALPNKKKTDPALSMVHSQAVLDRCQKADKASQKFLEDLGRKQAWQQGMVAYPRFKKRAKYNSFPSPQVWMTCSDKKKDTIRILEIVRFCPVPSNGMNKDRIKFACVTFSGIGKIKIRLHRFVDWQKAKTVTLKRTTSGDWYLSISGEHPLQPKLSSECKKTGVDVGLLFGSNTVGQGSCPNRLRLAKQTQGEARASAVLVLRGKSYRRALKPQLIPHLSCG